MSEIETHEVYENSACRKFVHDMLEVGFEVEHYHGRFHWQGPAVRTHLENSPTSLQEILAATDVECQWDQLGLGHIVYPKSSSKLLVPLHIDNEFDEGGDGDEDDDRQVLMTIYKSGSDGCYIAHAGHPHKKEFSYEARGDSLFEAVGNLVLDLNDKGIYSVDDLKLTK